MSATHTHVTVRDVPPANQTITIGRMYVTSPSPDPEPVFSSIVRAVDDEEDGAEVKVVAPRRGRRPRANEAAETK